MQYLLIFIVVFNFFLEKSSWAAELETLRDSLQLTRSQVPSEKAFGWSAIQSTIRQMTSDDRELPHDLGDLIENQVFAEVNADSLDALKFLYTNETLRRNRFLNGNLDLGILEAANPDRNLNSIIVALLSYKFQANRTNDPNRVNPGNLLVKFIDESLLTPEESQSTVQILENVDLFRTRFLVSLLVIRLAPIELPAHDEARIVANIAECVARPVNISVDVLIQKACRGTLTLLSQVFIHENIEGQNVNIQERLRQLPLSLYINRVQSPDNIKQTSLLAHQVPASLGVQGSIQISVAGRGSFSTLGAVVGQPGIAQQMGMDPGTPCENESNWKRGMIYKTANTNRASGSTDGVSITGMGVEHKTWGLTGSPGIDGTITSSFTVDKQDSANWIAVRGVKRGTYTSCPPSGSGNISSDAFVGPSQPQTQWTILQPVLGRAIGIRHSSSAEVHVTDSNSVFKGGIFTAPFKFAGSEIFQFNEAVVNQLNPSATLLFNLAERAPQNGLLKYVAAVQKALKPNGWLVPDPTETGIESSAFQALIRLDMLSDLAKMDLSAQAAAFPAHAPWYGEAPWKERQEFLRFALPMVGYKIQSYYLEKLERQMVLLGRPLLGLERTRQRLFNAVNALDVLREDDAMAMLGMAADLTHVERPAAPLARDLLIASVLGAREAIRNEWVSLTEKMINTCVVHFLMQADFRRVLGSGAVSGSESPVFLPECQEFFRDMQANQNIDWF